MGDGKRIVHIWSTTEKKYLEQITPGHHYKEIQELMCEKFNANFTISQIKGAISRYKLNTGFTGQFKEGSIPVNKGIKGVVYEGCKKTWFKKGNTPINHRSVGSERVNVDGYIEIKVSEPSKWRLKHNVIWEQHNGPIPKGYAIIFGDRDTLNCDPNNLILVSRQQLLILNRKKLIQKDADLTRTAVSIADIYQKINERKRIAK